MTRFSLDDLRALPKNNDLRLGRLLPGGWTILVGAIAIAIATPILFVFANIFAEPQVSFGQDNTTSLWQHLAQTVLGDYIQNSLVLMVGSSIGVLVIGVGTAWLVVACRFPGSGIFEWALLLPLAVPTYLLAYTYTDLLGVAGPLQQAIRDWLQVSYGEYWFPSIRSMGGAIALFAFTLYPYVYMLARVAFWEQSGCTLEASRSLGCGPWRSFVTVALPLARPAIAAGLSLVMMETLNDFGTVQYFGINTFTTGIYNTWFGMGDRVAASKLAAFLMLFVFILIVLERFSRRRARYYQSTGSDRTVPPYQLTGIRAAAASLVCLLPCAIGFLLPAGILLKMSLDNLQTFDHRFWELSQHSFGLAIATAILGVAIALIIAYGVRLQPNALMRFSARVASMGYAIPGAVIAVGILIPMGNLDNSIDAWMRSQFGISTGLLLSGTVFALIFAYIVRFLAVSFGTVESSLNKIHPNLDAAARSLGHNTTSTLLRVHIPMMASSLLTAGMLVFVDVMKELPATIIIRPFNFNTLAVRVYNLASDERLAEAAAPALAIVLVGIVPVILLSWQISRARQ